MNSDYYHFRQPTFAYQQFEATNGKPPPRNWWEAKLRAWREGVNGWQGGGFRTPSIDSAVLQDGGGGEIPRD